MTERSWFWGGTSTGDAALPAPYGAPYSDDMFTDVMSMMNQANRDLESVLPSTRTGYSGYLAPSINGSNVQIDTGVALVDGKLYTSDAVLQHLPPSDGAWSVVLRKNFVAQTIRQTLVATASVTRNDGITWDVELARVTKSGGALSSLIDMRVWGYGKGQYKFISPYVVAQTGTARNDFHSLMYTLTHGTTQTGAWFDFILPMDYKSDLIIDVVIGGVNNGNIKAFGGVVTTSLANISGVTTIGLNGTVTLNQMAPASFMGEASYTGYGMVVNVLNSTNGEFTGYRGQFCEGWFSRLGTDVADTLAGPVYLYAVRIKYR